MNTKYKYFMCRLCLRKSVNLTDIHGCKVRSGYNAAALISDLLQLVVSVTDMYPQLVCLECLKKLTDFQSFKESCWKAKVNFDTFYCNSPFLDVYGSRGMCDGGVSMRPNNGIPIETSDDYSDPCTEEYLEGRNPFSEIDIKEEPIEESHMRDPVMLESPHSEVIEIPEENITIKEEEIQESLIRDPLRLEPPYSDVREIPKEDISIKEEEIQESLIRDPLRLEPPYNDVGEIPKEDISIKEEEIQINQRLSVEEAPVTFVEKTGKITVPQVNSGMGREDTQCPLYVKQPNTSSTNYLYRETPSTNGADCNSNQVISKQLEGNDIVKGRNGLSHFNNTLSSSMFSFPLDYLVQLNLQGHIQSNNHIGMVAQNGGNNMHKMEGRKECKSSTVEEITVGEGVRNSIVNGVELGRKERKNVRKDGIEVGENEGKNSSVQYFCKECCKIFISTVDLDNHSCERQMVKSFDCKECGKKFKTEKFLWYHMRKHNLNVKCYCQICGKGFRREDDLSKHRFSHENDSPLQSVAGSSPRSSIPSGITVSDVGQIQNNCDQDKEQVENRQLKSITGKVCLVCNREYSSGNALKRHMFARHSEKNFKCNLCHKKFHTEKVAACHSRRHRKNRPYHCEVCGVGFYREVSLLKHISVHAKDEPFQCDRCGKKYNHKRPLWTHIARCYKKERYECNICNKRFHSEAYLSVHKTIHTGEKNLMCEVCGKTFRGSGALSVHKRQHTGVMPYYCNICDKRFTQKASLTTHNKRNHE